MTTGFTGADLANLVNEAALLAGRGSKTKVGDWGGEGVCRHSLMAWLAEGWNSVHHPSLPRTDWTCTLTRLPHLAQVARVDFDNAVLRSVAGIEKKRSILQGVEKEVVARHEVGSAARCG